MMQLYTKKEITSFDPDFFAEGWTFTGLPQYTDSVYEVGVIQPVLLGKYRNRLYLIAGNRRILSYLKAVERAKEDGTYTDKDYLHEIDAVIYHGVNPANGAALSLIENEERSDNPVATYQTIQKLKDEGKWDEVSDLIKMNKSRESKFIKYAKIDPVFLKAHLEGKIAKTILERIAPLNETRQNALKAVLQSRGKLTAPDVRQAKQTQVARKLGTMPQLPAVPLPQVEDKEPEPEMFVIVAENMAIGQPIQTSLVDAMLLRQDGDRVFRLVEV